MISDVDSLPKHKLSWKQVVGKQFSHLL